MCHCPDFEFKTDYETFIFQTFLFPLKVKNKIITLYTYRADFLLDVIYKNIINHIFELPLPIYHMDIFLFKGWIFDDYYLIFIYAYH